jgi:hypothetical protein
MKGNVNVIHGNPGLAYLSNGRFCWTGLMEIPACLVTDYLLCCLRPVFFLFSDK